MVARQVLGRPGVRATSYVVAAVLGVLASSASVWSTSHSAFTASTSSPGSTLVAGTVRLTTDAPGTSVFTSMDMVPGQTRERCVIVTYTGSLAADVRLFATDHVGDVGAYLDIDVAEGAGQDPSCGDFVASGTAYSGTLADLADTRSSYSSGIGAFAPSGSGQSRTYRFRYRLQAGPDGAERSGSARFTWEARLS